MKKLLLLAAVAATMLMTGCAALCSHADDPDACVARSQNIAMAIGAGMAGGAAAVEASRPVYVVQPRPLICRNYGNYVQCN
ncbi:hypothetical protein [Paraburkholderia sp. BCC1876]|uniref:hypothetical protein n=1 Tax=Paraburkholderia sp. BCC1876 TaxID=2676303 RepID=UPI001592067F|nr:hypothetical protein [Paraburkholderia sp. BCC1876]